MLLFELESSHKEMDMGRDQSSRDIYLLDAAKLLLKWARSLFKLAHLNISLSTGPDEGGPNGERMGSAPKCLGGDNAGTTSQSTTVAILLVASDPPPVLPCPCQRSDVDGWHASCSFFIMPGGRGG